MEEKKTVVTSGCSLTTVLGVVFLVLKLVGVIDWAWVWVLAPFWIPIALVIVIAIIWLLVVGIVAIVSR
jgi:hypothetical protein